MAEPQSYAEWLSHAASVPFPPTSWRHIDAYRHEAVMDGFVGFKAGDPPPGANHDPGYRWGYQNAARNRSGGDDGFDHLRHEFIRRTRDRT